ncbi:MAG: mannose-1-phosphate guanylyltransferase [Candidatus Caldatribacteriaceae bacterium]
MAVGVIMAGGRGERLWPLSREKRPKQFLRVGEKTLFRQTAERIVPMVGWENLYVVAPQIYEHLIREEVPEIPRENIVVEPMGRNTAPSIGLAALAVMRKKDEVMIVLPADHLVGEEERFRKIMTFGIDLADEKWLVTLGIVPHGPHTGYGYIRVGEEYRRWGEFSAMIVQEFKEKPTQELAKQYLQRGNYFWNSGMFLWKATVIWEEIARYMPDLYQRLQNIERHWGDQEFLRRSFVDLPTVSIDYGVMEKSSRVLLIPTNISWSDVGSFSSLAKVFGVDSEENTVPGQHLNFDTRRCFFLTQKPLFSLGVENVILIETEDLLFIASRDRSEELKHFLELIREREDLRKYL